MNTQIVLIALLCIYCAFGLYDIISEIRFRILKRRMLKAICDRVACNGHIIAPDDNEPRAVEAATGRQEYIFIEERDDLSESRMIFVSKDCNHITVLPWCASSENKDRQ